MKKTIRSLVNKAICAAFVVLGAANVCAEITQKDLMYNGEKVGYQVFGLGEAGNETAVVFTKTGADIPWSVPYDLVNVEFLVVGGGGGGGGSAWYDSKSPTLAGAGGGGGGVITGYVNFDGNSTVLINVGQGGDGGKHSAYEKGTNDENTSGSGASSPGSPSVVKVGDVEYVKAMGGGNCQGLLNHGGEGASNGGCRKCEGDGSCSCLNTVRMTEEDKDAKKDRYFYYDERYVFNVSRFGNEGGCTYKAAKPAAAGGGGGAAGVGGRAETLSNTKTGFTNGGDGGPGLESMITGVRLVFGSGGGGGTSRKQVSGNYPKGGEGGKGGEGAGDGAKRGKNDDEKHGGDAIANQGGGGGGAAYKGNGGDGGSGIVIFRYVLTPVKPVAVINLTYTGEELVGVHNGTGYYFERNSNKAINPGTYTAVAKLHEGCTWSDGTTDDVIVTWKIWPRMPEASMVAAENGYIARGLGVDGNEVAVVFTNENATAISWKAPSVIDNAQFLVVGGGGGGGADNLTDERSLGGAGGGGGGVVTGSVPISDSDIISVTVGGGGLGGAVKENPAGETGALGASYAGANSVVTINNAEDFYVVAFGGGRDNGAKSDSKYEDGNVGGIGGSNGGNKSRVATAQGEPLKGQIQGSRSCTNGEMLGSKGGVSSNSGEYASHGGGGACGAGVDYKGGEGYKSSITGKALVYGSGGGGGNAGSSGGVGGTGAGNGNLSREEVYGFDALPNQGGGGGGSGGGEGLAVGTKTGGNGGSGIVAFRFAYSEVASVDGLGYLNLADALTAAVENGKTLTLVANVDDISLYNSLALKTDVYSVGTITLTAADAVLTANKDVNVVSGVTDYEVVESEENGVYTYRLQVSNRTITLPEVTGATWYYNGAAVDGDTITVSNGTEVTLTLKANEGYQFEGGVESITVSLGAITENIAISDDKYSAPSEKQPSGKINYFQTLNHSGRMGFEAQFNDLYAKKSLIVKVYDAEGNQLTETKYQKSNYPLSYFGGKNVLTCSMVIGLVDGYSPSSTWGMTEVKVDKLTVGNMPAKVELWVDDELVDTRNSGLTNPEVYQSFDFIYKEASVGSTLYATLGAAVEAAEANAEIVLLADVSTDFSLDKSITLNMNEKAYTGTITLTAADAVLTAPEGLNVVTTVANSEVKFENGAYTVVEAVVTISLPNIDNATWKYNDETVTGSITVNKGTTVELTLNAADGYQFANGETSIKVTFDSVNENIAADNSVFDIVAPQQPVVAKIGDVAYATFAEALTAAKAMTGDVTVEIYEKVTLNSALSGNYSSITFVGKDTDAEIYLEVQGYITATGKTVNFQDLTLSKSQGGFITNAGFMNTAFGVYDVMAVNYTNCTFSNGAYASSGTVTFTKCIFKRSWDKYGLWAYGDVNCIVDECTFDDYRGIKMYAEGAAKTTELTVKKSNFSAVTDKPAIVLTYGESVNLEGNTYSSTGTFELDLDGAPNGVAVTSDVAPICKNDNGACGVLVDGKIYTTVAQAAAVATSGSTVTLLHDSTETVELPEGVTLNKNNYAAAGVTVAQPVDPNTHYINNLDELKAFRDAVNNGNTYEGMTVKLAQDIDLEGSDANLWTPIGANADASAMVFKGTFDGQGHKIFNLYVKQGAGYHAAGLFGATRGTVKNLTIENAYVESLSSGSATVNGTAVVAGSTAYGATIDNVHVKTATVKGNRYVAGIVGYMDGKVTNCTVEDVTIIATPDNLTGAYDNGDKVGGIVGYCNSGAKEISSCALKGENSLTAYRDVAGIVGCASSGVSVSDNTATGKLTVTVDQMTNSYGEKTPNAGTLYGRNATAEMQAENAEAKADTEKLAYSESIVKGSAKIGNTCYATLADALAAAQGSENIVIDLLADATLDITAWETLAIGGDATETITINGNGNTLTFNKLNSDWNHIVTKNDAKLILNNMTITDSGYNNGPWNRYDINFACDVELNDVTSTKALAFKADATLNDVAVTETNDAYAIWIQPNGQNVVIDGLTVDSAGRGIKIDEQYVDAASKVELSVKDATFTTAKKAAIVVKSAAGADITLENVDISGVAADNVNAVWNDEDSSAVYGNITVTGGTLAQEGVANFVATVGKDDQISAYYSDLHAAMVAAKAGDTVKLIADVDLAGKTWEPVSFKGAFDGQNKIISNLTINKPGVSNTGFITSLNGSFKNVIFTNPTVTGGENTGVVAGRAGGSAALAENITINGTIKVETTHSGYARAGGIVGGWGYGNYKNITVDGGDASVSYIKHTGGGDGRYVAGIVGHADDVDSYENCVVKNITISGGWLCGGIAGPGPSDGVATGCAVENIKMNADYSGGMFGWYFGNGTIEDSSIKNVEFTDGTSCNGAIGGYSANPDANVDNVVVENVVNGGKPLLEHVAAIGTTYYMSLQAAVDAAQNGETVALIADVNESILVVGKEVTLDLNGKTVSGVEGSYDTVYIEDAGLTVQDSGNTGKIVCKDGPIYDAVCLGANANFTLKGGTLESDKDDVIYVDGSGSSVAIINGTINGSNALTAWNGVSTISGGIITGKLLVQESATLSVTGGTFTVDPSEFAAYGYGVTDNGDGTWTVGEMSRNIFIGETAYLTLDEAFKAATENAVIEIKAAGEYIWPATAIPAGVTVKGAVDGVVATTDGKTIINATTLTVENIDFAAHNYAAFISNPATTEMTFTDCSFTPSSPELYAICVDTAAEDAVFTFNDCVFNGFATFTSKVGTLDVNGGEINAGFVVRQDATIDGVEFAEDARVQLGTTDTVTDVNVTITGCTVADTNDDGNVPAVKDLVNETNTAIGSGNVVIVDGDVIYGAVAKIGDTYYETLASALAAAQDGATVELLWADGDAPIAMNGSVYGKSVTITGTATVDWSKGFLFVGRGGEGNGTVIFDNANLASASNNASTGIHVSGREKNTNNKYDGTVVINNSTIVLDYLIDKGAMTMTNSTLTVKNGFAVGGRPASETESGVDATATFDLTNGSTLIVNNHNGMGLGYEAIGVMTIDSTSTFECTLSFLVTGKGALNVAKGGKVEFTGAVKTLTVNGALASAGDVSADIVAGENADIEISGGVYTQDVNEWCVEGYVALKNFSDKYVVGVAPAAEVENLGATTVAAGGYTVVTPFGGSNSTSDPMELPFVMKYVAVETPEAGAASPYADWYGDFVISFSGLKNGSISGAGCYLAGHYGTFGWVKVPVDNLTIENGVRYPVMLSTLGNGQKYDYICGGVDTFLCAMYLPESVLEENPDLKVSLELCVVDNANGPEAAQQALATTGSPYAYQSAVKEFGAQDFIDVELPEVEVVDIKNTLTDSDPDLTFALNFAIKDMENLTDEYLEKLFAKYGNYYTDYVLTISGLSQESVTFNANGDADGYLAGQYDAWSQNWVSVPFENVTVENGQSLYIMEYAAKLMGQQGLRFTLAEVAEIVQNFDCGVYFTPEFLAANPDLKVDLELKVFTEDQNGNKINDISVATNTFDKDDFGVAAVVAEGKQTKYFATLAEAFTDVENGETVMILAPGTYALTTSGKNITVTGAVDGVVFDNIGKKNMGGANVTFNNVTFDYYPNVNYTGLQHSGDLVYNNCTFDGQVFLYGASETFNNCTFNQNSADAYNVWTYTADVVNFNECTFNSAGKSVLVYNENSAEFNTVNVAKCEFIASASVDGKAAIEMDSSLTAGINLTIDAATTATGFGSGNVSGNSLWNNKKGNSTDANNDITVVVNNETVLAPVTFVAKIGNVGYITLQAAVDAAKNGETVDLLAACAENVTVAQNPDIAFTIEGNGNEMTGTITVNGKSSAYPAAGLTIKNIAFDATEITEDASINLGGSNNTRYTSNVTVLDCSFIDSNSDKDKAAIKNYTGGCKNLTVSGCSAQGMHSLIQVKGVAGITVSDIVIVECKNGISVGTSTGVTIAKADIDVAGYGFRADGSGAYDAIVENCKITAELPVVIRKNTADGYALTLNGENELNGTNGNAYAVVFTNGDDGTYEIPAGNFIYTNNGNEVKVYPVSAYVAEVGGKKYVELEEALKALSDGATLKLLADIEIDGTWDCRFNGAKITADNVKINGNGKTIKLTGTVDDKNWNTVFRFEGKGVWVQNLTLDVSEAKGVQRGITAKFDIAVIQSTFIGNGTTSKYGLIFGEGAGNEIGGLEINVIASTFKDWTYGVSDNRNGQDVRYINMDANVFDNANVIVSASKTVYFDNNKMDGGYVNISSYTVPNDLLVRALNSKVDADFAGQNRIVADRIANAYGFLTPVAEDEIGKLYLFLDEAINVGSAIKIRDNINTDSAFVVNKQIAIDLNGKTIATTENDKSGDGVFHVVAGGDLTIEDGSADKAGTINGVGGNNYNIAVWADGGKVTINGGNFTNVGATDENGNNHFDLIYAKNGGEVVINGGKFVCESPAWTLNIHDGSRQNSSITVNGGTFVGFDPRNNAAETAGTTFMAPGKYTLVEGGSYSVVTPTDYILNGAASDAAAVDPIDAALAGAVTVTKNGDMITATATYTFKVTAVDTVNPEKSEYELTGGTLRPGKSVKVKYIDLENGGATLTEKPASGPVIFKLVID